MNLKHNKNHSCYSIKTILLLGICYNKTMDTKDIEKEDEENRTNNQNNTSDSSNKNNSTGDYEEDERRDD